MKRIGDLPWSKVRLLKRSTPKLGNPHGPKPSRLWMIFGIPATLRMAVGVGKMGILWGVCFDMIYGVCTLTFLDFDVWTTSCGFWPHDSRSVKHSLHYTNFTHTHTHFRNIPNQYVFLIVFGDDFFYPKNPDPAKKKHKRPSVHDNKWGLRWQLATSKGLPIPSTYGIFTYICLHLPYFTIKNNQM